MLAEILNFQGAKPNLGMGSFSQLNYKQIEINSVLPASSEERNPVKSHPEREKFFKQINSGMPINRTRKYVNISILDRIRAIRKKIKVFLN